MSSDYSSSAPRVARRPRLPDARRVSQAELEARHAVRLRDSGLWRIGAATRWLLAGAVGATGTLALLAASTFHGHAVASPAAAQSTQAAGASAPPSTDASSQLAPPAQAPTSSAAAPVVVSGGS